METNISSLYFNATFIKKAIEFYDEGWFLDFKRCHYHLDDQDSRKKFIRHLIAFANTAARTRRPCFIIFGVDNADHNLIFDLVDDYPGKSKPKNWYDPNLSIEYKQVDLVQQRLKQCAKEFIHPIEPDFNLEYGYYNGKFISYLEILPKNVSSPYKLRKAMSGSIRSTVFVRHNAESVPLPKSEIPFLKEAINNFAYLSKLDWEKLLQYHRTGKFSEADQLVPSFENKVKNKQTTALSEINKFLDEGKQIILVKSPAGMGKTTLLHKLTNDLASKLNPVFNNKDFGQRTEDSSNDSIYRVENYAQDMEVLPSIPVPIYVHLRITIDSPSSFNTSLGNHIEMITGKSSNSPPSGYFKIPGSKWILILDGIDELRDQSKSGKVLEKWITHLPQNVQVVISSRPQFVEGWDDAEVIELSELSEDEVIDLLSYYIDKRSDNVLEKQELRSCLLKLLNKEKNLLEVISSPRAFNGFVNTVFNTDIPFKPEIDREFPILSEIKNQTLEITGNQHVPVINTESLIQSEDQIIEELSEEDDGEQDFISFPETANIMNGIITYIVKQEILRQKSLGSNPWEKADAAREELDKTAWHIDWIKYEFDKTIVIENKYIRNKNLQWAERISLVIRIEFNKYRFRNQLIREYFAAEYGYKRPVSQVVGRYREFLNYTESKSILNLLNQLRTSEGMEQILI